MSNGPATEEQELELVRPLPTAPEWDVSHSADRGTGTGVGQVVPGSCRLESVGPLTKKQELESAGLPKVKQELESARPQNRSHRLVLVRMCTGSHRLASAWPSNEEQELELAWPPTGLQIEEQESVRPLRSVPEFDVGQAANRGTGSGDGQAANWEPESDGTLANPGRGSVSWVSSTNPETGVASAGQAWLWGTGQPVGILSELWNSRWLEASQCLADRGAGDRLACWWLAGVWAGWRLTKPTWREGSTGLLTGLVEGWILVLRPGYPGLSLAHSITKFCSQDLVRHLHAYWGLPVYISWTEPFSNNFGCTGG